MDNPRAVKTTTDSGCYDGGVDVLNDVEARSEAAAMRKLLRKLPSRGM